MKQSITHEHYPRHPIEIYLTGKEFIETQQRIVDKLAAPVRSTSTQKQHEQFHLTLQKSPLPKVRPYFPKSVSSEAFPPIPIAIKPLPSELYRHQQDSLDRLASKPNKTDLFQENRITQRPQSRNKPESLHSYQHFLDSRLEVNRTRQNQHRSWL